MPNSGTRSLKGLGEGLSIQTQFHYTKGKQGFKTMDFNIKTQLRIRNP
jgi:hypothetical protein